jgi:hypothetical protein
VQRLPDGIEVNFYRMRAGRPNNPDELSFPNRTEELLLAKVRIDLHDFKRKLDAKVWCVQGFLFSIEYAGSANYFEEAAGMHSPPQFAISCELAGDLMSPAARG